MSEYEKLYNFQNLYKAHKVARLGKRDTREVIDFELSLALNLSKLSESIRNKTYKISGYYCFYVHDPKKRKIHALHYADRVVQHCLCDEILAPVIDKKLVYDNAACRLNKGTHFALKRVCHFLHCFYNKNKTDGYFLKCDIRKFFDNIDHEILKCKLRKVFTDENLLYFLDMIIDSFEVTPGKGLPMGNQTSQWFAIYYLDGLDRMIKEKLRIKYYSRYMDDCVIIHQDRNFLKNCIETLSYYVNSELKLEFNEKTQVFPLKNGVNYLGWHIYVTENGKIVRKVRLHTKKKYKRSMKKLRLEYKEGCKDIEKIKQILSSYRAHLSFGDTYMLQKKVLNNFVLSREIL